MSLRFRFLLFAAVLTGCLSAFVGGPARAQAPSAAPARFGDWALDCRAAEAGRPRQCRLFQNVVQNPGFTQLVNISIARAGPDAPYVASVTVPLGILLQPGLFVLVDQQKLVQFPLYRCNVNGCLGTFPVTDRILQAFGSGTSSGVVFRQPNGKYAHIRFSLKGFAAGFEALKTM